ncbi:MAPEG family protein [Undibacterium sp.]|uniref:MAPEG family protein n=1 Tax=Undibacterium sp. TaxID=1914977 RepID=UPI00272F67FB|nr:MAPEG family protein [Undibacterium sp.]MDP1976106.1 MAPEG family protein [Undibacterium sp.]
MMNYPALSSFVLALLALFLKASVLSVFQVISRIRSRRYLLPEDAALAGLRPVESESDLVQRCARVWRNDVENLPLFLALAICYVLLGAEQSAANWLFGSYVVIRYLHTLIYLRGMQPLRTIMYLSGMAICWTIAYRIFQQIHL